LYLTNQTKDIMCIKKSPPPFQNETPLPPSLSSSEGHIRWYLTRRMGLRIYGTWEYLSKNVNAFGTQLSPKCTTGEPTCRRKNERTNEQTDGKGGREEQLLHFNPSINQHGRFSLPMTTTPSPKIQIDTPVSYKHRRHQ